MASSRKIDDKIFEQVEIEAKYAGYLKRELEDIDKQYTVTY